MGKRGGDLESLHENSLLSLDSDVLWPLHETGEVPLWLDVTSQSEVTWVLLEQRCLSTTARSTLDAAFNDHFLSFNSFLHLYPRKHVREVNTNKQFETCKCKSQPSSLSPLTIMIDIFYLINNKPSVQHAQTFI